MEATNAATMTSATTANAANMAVRFLPPLLSEGMKEDVAPHHGQYLDPSSISLPHSPQRMTGRLHSSFKTFLMGSSENV